VVKVLDREITVQTVREWLIEALKPKSMTADKDRSVWGIEKRVFKPKDIETYYEYYKEYDLIRAPIDDLTEAAVGQGFYTTVEQVTPILQKSKSKDLIDEFNAYHQVDSLLPNIVRNMLIAGFCPVETRLTRGLVENCALKIIHPKTIKAIDEQHGKVISITQEAQKKGQKDVVINGRDLAWFVYGQIANNVQGTSLIMSLYNTLNTLIKATDNVDAILDRYISPLGIWKSRRSIEAIKTAAIEREAGEDIYLGELDEDEMNFLIKTEFNPRESSDRCIYYLKQY